MSKVTMIVNGGDPLPGCPETWEEARRVETILNEGNGEGDDVPLWGFDCGFKLDYDGPIVSISSRFYPPKTLYGPTWDGSVGLYLMGEKIQEKKFDCPTLEELKTQVQAYVTEIKDKIFATLKSGE